MRTLSKDARNFVDGIAGYIKKDQPKGDVGARVQTLLHRATKEALSAQQGRVESCIPLSLAEKKNLYTLLFEALGHDVTLEYHVSPSLLGGIRVKVADWVIDTSLVTQLTQLSENILQSYEQ